MISTEPARTSCRRSDLDGLGQQIIAIVSADVTADNATSPVLSDNAVLIVGHDHDRSAVGASVIGPLAKLALGTQSAACRFLAGGGVGLDAAAGIGRMRQRILSILTVFGRVADVVLVLALLAQCLLGFRLVWTLLQHVRGRRVGLRDEREMLALSLPDDRALPAVLVQIPSFNEGALVRRVLDAVTALDWPSDRLSVQVLDDSTDASAALARAAVAEHRARGHEVTLLQRADRAGFKAGALKAGLACTDQPYVAIFDADYVPARRISCGKCMTSAAGAAGYRLCPGALRLSQSRAEMGHAGAGGHPRLPFRG